MNLNLDTTSLREKFLNPPYQAAFVFAAILLFNIVAKLLQWVGAGIEQRFPWTIGAAFIFFFAVWSALSSLMASNLDNYWGRSMSSYVVLSGLAGLTAWLFSSLSIDQAGPYKSIFIVLSIGYLVFLSIISFMKKIVDFAQKEEWNQPRPRKRKR